jgi:hypothetical protein
MVMTETKRKGSGGWVLGAKRRDILYGWMRGIALVLLLRLLLFRGRRLRFLTTGWVEKGRSDLGMGLQQILAES